MWHGPPGMVFWCRLPEPDIAGASGELAAFERADDRIAVANLATCRVHDIGAALHLGDQRVVEHVLGFWVQRDVDGDHIADFDHRLDV